MTTRYETYNAAEIDVNWGHPLSTVGDDEVSPGEYVLTLSNGETIAAIKGSAQEVADLATQLGKIGSYMLEHAARPLTLGDFAFDEQMGYRCPRCEETFDPSMFMSLFALTSRIDQHITNHQPQHEKE